MKSLLVVLMLSVPAMAEVNIAEVEGKYKEKTIQDAVHQHRVLSLQYMNLALHETYIAGYGQAMIDYGIFVGTAPAKVKAAEEEYKDEEKGNER